MYCLDQRTCRISERILITVKVQLSPVHTYFGLPPARSRLSFRRKLQSLQPRPDGLVERLLQAVALAPDTFAIP